MQKIKVIFKNIYDNIHGIKIINIILEETPELERNSNKGNKYTTNKIGSFNNLLDLFIILFILIFFYLFRNIR